MKGKKTYAVAAVLFAVAALMISGTTVPGFEGSTPGELIMMALTAAGIRHGITTEGSKA